MHLLLYYFRHVLLTALFLLLIPPAHANMLIPDGASFSLPADSTFDLSCGVLDVQGGLSLNNAEVSNIMNVDIASGGQLDGGDGIIQLSGNWQNEGVFNPGNGTVIIDDSCSTSDVVFSGNTVFNNLTIIDNSGRSVFLPGGRALTVNGTLTLLGNGTTPLQLLSNDGSQATIILGPSAQVIRNNVNLASNVQIGTGFTPAVAIPTLGLLPLALLALLLAIVAACSLRQRRLA